MICHKCGSKNTDSARFCCVCGVGLRIDELEEQEESISQDADLAADDPASFADIEDGVFELPSTHDKEASKEPIVLPPLNASEDDVIEEPFDMELYAPKEGEEDFDFSEIDDPDATKVIPKVDTSGIDETIVDASYVPPVKSWNAGDTMEMPPIAGDAKTIQKEFRAPDPQQKKKEKRRAKIAIVFTAFLIIAALASVGITYYLEMWGGKTLPDVVGMTQEAAAQELEELGFEVKVSQLKSDVEEGKVLVMEPSAGSRFDEGTQVILHVATSRVVPDVVGMTQEAALELLEEEGYTEVEVKQQKSSETEGTVLEITPNAGEKALSSTAIEIVVAQAYTVPNVVGLDSKEAVQKLQDEGYDTYITYSYSEEKEGTVLSIDPEADSKSPQGSTVTLSVAKSRSSELISAAWSYFEGRDSIKVDGITYLISSLKDVSYTGNDTTVCVLEAQAVTILDGEEVSGSVKDKTVTVVWNSDNEVESIS